MPLLDDGTVIPSGLGYHTNLEGATAWRSGWNDTTLRTGRVIAAYPPDSNQNINKKYIEYDVEVQYANGTSGVSNIIYPRAQMVSVFGGVADYISWTPRIENFDQKTQTGLGSRVLLMCLNGNTRGAYIIGGIPHPEAKRKETFKDNHHFDLEFNGSSISINNAGDFKILHKGATDAKGTLLNENNTGASFSMVENGDLLFNSGTKTGQVKVTTTGGLKINAATEAFLNASTYRKQQSLLHGTINPLLASLATAIGAAGASITTGGGALATAAGLHIVPVVGSTLGAPSMAAAAVAVSAGGASLTACAPLIVAIQTALTQFEALSETYLSKKHGHSD